MAFDSISVFTPTAKNSYSTIFSKTGLVSANLHTVTITMSTRFTKAGNYGVRVKKLDDAASTSIMFHKEVHVHDDDVNHAHSFEFKFQCTGHTEMHVETMSEGSYNFTEVVLNDGAA